MRALVLDASLRFVEVPVCCKLATVVLIPKGGKDPGLLANRSLSLINSMTKVLEAIVREKAQEFLKANRIIPASQFGIRALLIATQQEMYLAESIPSPRQGGGCTI